MQNNEKDFNYFFRLDILKLFSAFNHIDSFRFSDFIIIWNEMKFFQLFALPRFFPFDYRNFMKDTLKITAEYLYDTELDLQVRTAALYTIYGLYFHQMNRPRIKISVTPNHWIKILEFVDVIDQAEHVDVEYVFRFLLHSDAFEFSSIYEIENNVPSLKSSQKSFKPSSLEHCANESTLNMKDFAISILSDNLTEEMETIHDAYLQIKDEFLNTQARCSKLTYINENFRDFIHLNGLEKATHKAKVETQKMKASSKKDYLETDKYDLDKVDLDSRTDETNTDSEEY